MTGATAALPERTSLRRFAGLAGLGVVAVLAMVALLHDTVAPYARGEAQSHAVRAAPGDVHLFGTDQLGRDVLSESIHALGQSMTDAGIGFAVALAFGTLAGLVAAHLLGAVGSALRIPFGVVGAVPALLLAVLLAFLLGLGSPALAAGLAVAPVQFLRAFDRTRALLSLRQTDFARASGVTPMALLRRDLTHEFGAAIVSLAARGLAAVIVTLATMSFFGFGAVAPVRDLGLLIANARPVLDTAWWAAAVPAGVLVLIVLAAHLAARLSDDDRP